MHSRKLGPFDVSAIGLGCMNMSMGYGPADDTVSTRLLNEALDAGYSMLDTALIYGHGHNETLIGKTLKHRRQEFILATKGGMSRTDDGKQYFDGRPEAIRANCEGSLQRLQTDVIDLYYLHRLDTKVPIEETVGAMAELVQEGKVKTLGLSEMSSDTLRRAHAVHPITAMQSEYSLWSRTPETSMLDTCAELGVTFVAFSPLARAFLAGAAQDVTQLTDSDIRCTNARPRFEPEAFASNIKLLEPYREIAERVGCSMAQLALAWLLGIRNAAGEKTIIPIPGTGIFMGIVDVFGAGDIELDQATMDELDVLINENTVTGARYTDDLMQSIDSEKDRR